MKNQYFGDVYDYIKYALIRRLNHGGEIPTALCWMMTPNDRTNDGRNNDYLNDPERWRGLDPEVFDLLKDAIEHNERDTAIAEQSKLLANTTFFHNTLTDNFQQRSRWFDRFLKEAEGHHLVIFDPNNGLEVPSVWRGKSGSTRYLYMVEATLSYEAGHSLLVFQFIPRIKRDEFIRSASHDLMLATNRKTIHNFRAENALFLCAPQPDMESEVNAVTEELKESWGEILEVYRYPG